MLNRGESKLDAHNGTISVPCKIVLMLIKCF